MTTQTPQAICIFGPTASGKTSLGIDLANAHNGEIINADSRQIYQQIDIISAMPSAEEFAAAPHHLFQFLSPEKRYSVAQYQKDAAQKAQELVAQGKMPIFVGGTGLYLNSLIHGINHIPDIPRALEESLEVDTQTRGLDALHAELTEVDPVAASRIHATDPQRIVRALAVYRHTGQPISAWQSAPKEGALNVNWIKIAINPERATLHNRLEQRMGIMVKEGILEEVKALYDAKLSPKLPALTGLGISDIYKHFDGNLTQEEALNAMLIATRQYARRQITWLNNTFKPDLVIKHPKDALPQITKILSKNNLPT